MIANSAPPRLLEPTESAIAEAGRVLRDGWLVAFPTETVYGLGADATNDRAVASIFEAKGRPSFNPLIVHIADPRHADGLVAMSDAARALMTAFWPGTLTLVLPRHSRSPASLLCSAGLDTIAVRMPDHPVALALIRTAGRPLAAPSANRSGAVSPTSAAHVAESLGANVSIVLDGGPCRVGVESTVLDLSTARPTLLRPGGVPVEALEAALGTALVRALDDAHAPKSPGMLESHYAPGLPVRLGACCPRPGEALLAFGPAPADAVLNLSPSGDLHEAAANLFAMLRALDLPEYTGIAVMPIPDHDLGLAINDRLRRAAAPRKPA